MRIRQIIAYRVKSILRLDHSLNDDWLGRVVDGLMVIGPNGAGKSTLLEGIVALWEEWGNWLDAVERRSLVPLDQDAPRSAPDRRSLASPGQGDSTKGEPARLPISRPLFGQPNFGLLAVQLVDLDPRRPIWLAAGGEAEVAELKHNHPDDYVVAAVGQRRDRERRLRDWGLDWPGAPSDQSWLARWAEQRRRSLLGAAELPNVLYFEPDNRQLLAPRNGLDLARDLQDPPRFNWVTRYEPAARRAGHLSSMLYRMQVTDPAGLEAILKDINSYLRAKRIGGFSPSGDLEVTIGVESEQAIKHLVYELSSGERQVFILIAMCRRWLRHGGLVLIDEPDLHLHPSLRGALLTRLRRIVAEREGQLIITSQSVRLWKEFIRPAERIELGEQTEVQEE